MGWRQRRLGAGRPAFTDLHVMKVTWGFAYLLYPRILSSNRSVMPCLIHVTSPATSPEADAALPKPQRCSWGLFPVWR